ncbi:MAG TPA: TIGR04053 family radical SAM/SPASM domain-containing protein [Methylomirabilota bacterium]
MTPYARSPFIAIWETTRACALACVHCRAEAIPRRDPEELTTGEGKALLERVAAFGDPPPLVVFTGGDPLRRPDVAELVAYGTRIGLVVSLTPSGTAAATAEKLGALRDAGLARLAVSVDAASAEAHDAFRRVRGSHRNTLRIIAHARALGLPLQINTTVCRQTAGELPALVEQVERFGAVLWALFFLIPIGRARADHGLGAEEIETVLRWAADLQPRVPFGIKTTESPQYHRVVGELAHRSAAGAQTWPPHSPQSVSGLTSRSSPQTWPPHSPQSVSGLTARSHVWPPRSSLRAPRAVTDGNGFVFVDHVGNICPSGFLPMRAGNVRQDDLVTVYREHPLFLALRDPARLGGRCGRCEWRDRCGGSRARAYAASGDPLAGDPGCAYQPAEAVQPAGTRSAP